MTKRLFDIGLALVGIAIFLLPMLICAVVVKLTSKGPVIFSQERVGLNFKPFRIFKFRSMVVDAPNLGAQVTVDRDPRITGIGRIMRKTKLDELPQLFNVLFGDMSFVGPRPEVPKYVEIFREDYKVMLSVRPGITGLDSIAFRHEEDILAQAADPQAAYLNEVAPAKIKLAKQYVEKSSVLFDVKLIWLTIVSVLGIGGASDTERTSTGSTSSSTTP
ncbi:MAG: sugar transferase [Mariniblastus sp.]